MTDVAGLTLLDKLRDAIAFEAANPASAYTNAEAVVWDALPAVVALIEAAQGVLDAEHFHESDACVICERPEGAALRAALAPFVGEATQ